MAWDERFLTRKLGHGIQMTRQRIDSLFGGIETPLVRGGGSFCLGLLLLHVNYTSLPAIERGGGECRCALRLRQSLSAAGPPPLKPDECISPSFLPSSSLTQPVAYFGRSAVARHPHRSSRFQTSRTAIQSAKKHTENTTSKGYTDSEARISRAFQIQRC